MCGQWTVIGLLVVTVNPSTLESLYPPPGVTIARPGTSDRHDRLKTFRRAVLLPLINFVWLMVNIIVRPRVYILRNIRLQVCRKKEEHIVNIGPSFVPVTLVVNAIVRLLVTFILKKCLGKRPPNSPKLALLVTVVATVIIPGLCLFTPCTMAENILAQRVPLRRHSGILALTLNGFALRKCVGRCLVGRHFLFPTACIRISIGLCICPVLVSIPWTLPTPALLIGFKQATFTPLKNTFGINSRPTLSPVPWTCPITCLFIIGTWPSEPAILLPKLKHVLEAWNEPRHRPTFFIPLETDTRPLPNITTKPAPTWEVPPTVLHVTLLASVLLLTIEIIQQPLLASLSVRVTLSFVETEAESRLAPNVLVGLLRAPGKLSTLLHRCKAVNFNPCLAKTPRAQDRRLIL